MISIIIIIIIIIIIMIIIMIMITMHWYGNLNGLYFQQFWYQTSFNTF